MRTDREIDRTISFRNSQGVSVHGTLSKLTRRTIVFEVYNPYSLVQTSEVLTGIRVRRGESVIYSGDAVVVNLVSTGIMSVVSATLLGAWSDLSSLIAASAEFESEVAQFIDDWDRANRLDPDYQVRVADLRSFLSDLSFWLDQVDIAQEGSSGSRSSGVNDATFARINALIEPKLSSILLGFETASRKIADDQVDIHKQLVHRDLHPLLLASPFFDRVYFKPLGYAGDYEMVNMILKRERGGPTTYAQIVNDWFLAGGPPTAHRNRVRILEQVLAETTSQHAGSGRTVRVLNIGCGPAWEVQRFVGAHPLAGCCAIDLMDFNQETLDYAAARIAEAAAGRAEIPLITPILRSVHDLLKQAVQTTDAGPEYDLVYCAGLFDYLSDRICRRLVPMFASWTRPGGRIVVTNVHSGHYARGIMEHLMEWHLVLRDEANMLSLMPNGQGVSVYTDDTGINVFLDIRKTPA